MTLFTYWVNQSIDMATLYICTWRRKAKSIHEIAVKSTKYILQFMLIDNSYFMLNNAIRQFQIIGHIFNGFQ